MRVSITCSGPSLTEADVLDLETRLRISLPAPYTKFLLHHNGGEPDLDHYPIDGMGGNPFGEIRMLLGIGTAEEYNDLERTLLLMDERLPPQFLPIGYSSSDDLICLSLAGQDRGTVYFVDTCEMPEPAPWHRSGYANAYFVAEDFEAFLQSLDTFEAYAKSSPG
jgi:hypothetical protein